jgi:hypothetical protein
MCHNRHGRDAVRSVEQQGSMCILCSNRETERQTHGLRCWMSNYSKHMGPVKRTVLQRSSYTSCLPSGAHNSRTRSFTIDLSHTAGDAMTKTSESCQVLLTSKVRIIGGKLCCAANAEHFICFVHAQAAHHRRPLQQ